MATDELVLVVPAAKLARLGAFAGLTTAVERYLPELFNPANVSFRPRGEVETDPSWLQLIPYVVLSHDGRLFHYTRGAAGGERRLHAKRSVGIGGHINPSDTARGDPYRTGLLRELAEEVAIDTGYEERLLGLVHDPTTPVGQVHLGVVHVWSVREPAVRAVDPALTDGGFAIVSQLVAQRDGFETWSQLVLDALGGAGR
jgi:predicted NUDIX family phosphoesterase